MTEHTLPPGLWISLSELARQRGISRVSAKERVDRLVSQGLIETRRQGNKRLVELAAFDRAVGSTGDTVKELAAETVRERAGTPSPALRDAQTRRAEYEAQLKALDLAERQGLILPIKGEHGIETAARKIAEAFARNMDGLLRHADELATAVSKEGTAGARRVLKQIGNRMREQVAASLTAIAAEGQAAELAGPIMTGLLDTDDETEQGE